MQNKASTGPRRNEYVSLLLLVAVALLLRIVLAGLPRVIRWDEPDYLLIGRNWLTGQGYTVSGVPEMHYTPLFSLLAGSMWLLTSNPEVGSAFWYVLLGALLVIPVYMLAKRTYGRRIAFLAGALVAIAPSLSSSVLYWGTMTEPPFVFLVYCALWVASIAVDTDKLWAHGVSGALLALAYLVRPEGTIWLACFGLFFLLIRLFRRQLFRLRTLSTLGVYVAAALLVAAPYAYLLYHETGRVMATGKLSITYDIGEAVLERDPVLYDKVTASLDSETGEVLWWSENRFDRGMLDVFLEDPAKFLDRTWRNARWAQAVIMSRSYFPFFFLAPVVLGWFRVPWGRKRFLHEALLLAGILPVLSFLPFHIEARFFAPAFPALLIWIAAGIWAIGAWLSDTLANWRSKVPEVDAATIRARWQMIVVVVLTCGVFAYWGYVHVQTIEEGQRDLAFAHKAAGLWLGQNSDPEAAVMARDLAIALYADRGFVASPRADYASYLDYARRKGATYLVVDEHELRVLRPHLAFLLNDSSPPPELDPVFSASDAHGRTIIYRIKD